MRKMVTSLSKQIIQIRTTSCFIWI